MIRFVRGVVSDVAPDHAVIDVCGVGYRVFLTAQARSAIRKGDEVVVHTHFRIREDGAALYGFLKREELGLFESLLLVSGVGPKVALGIVSTVSPEEFHKAVLFEDVRSLTRIPGIGKKTAHRILLELKDRLGDGSPKETLEELVQGPEVEAVEALVALGYERAQAARCVGEAAAAGEELAAEDLLRIALKALGGGAKPDGRRGA